MAALFEREGYTVMLGQDSIEVLTLLDQQAPHVIVVHAALSSGLGLEALHTLRSRRSPEATIPVVLLSADALLLLAADSHQPQVLSGQPVELHELVHHVGRLAP